MIWKPSTTVAAVIEQNGKYLLVEEKQEPDSGLFLQGAIRETLEETAYTFVPEYLIGIYQWHSKRADTTYIRFAFAGSITQHDPHRTLDDGIVRATWFDFSEISQQINRHRSPLVMQCILDHRNGRQFPLDLIKHYD